MNTKVSPGEMEGQVFHKRNQPPLTILPSLKEALIAAECRVEGEGDRGLVLCEEHLEALQQGCILTVYLPSGTKLFIRYKPAHPPRTW